LPTDIAEVLFYHLERNPLDGVLPTLVEKTLARGWRAVVQTRSPERRDALDELLWTFKDGSFVPHGTATAGNAAHQPVFLTTEPENPNGAAVRFMVDGALLDDLAPQLAVYKRIVFMFDGNSSDELAQARATWKAAKATGAALTYWQQGDSGGWEKKA
jgi:DNA polymerase III subunit chi